MKRICGTFLTIVLMLGLCACGQNVQASWQEQYDLGIKYLSEGNYEEAVIAFTAAIEIDAKRPEAFIGRGDAYALSGDTEENLSAAQADYEAAIALDETLPGGWLGLADVYIRQGDYDKALEILREALEKTGSDQSIADKIAEMEGGNYIDTSGKERRIISYDAYGNILYFIDFEYDRYTGQKTIATSYGADRNQTNQILLTYDEEGREVNSYLIWNDGIIRSVLYEYDSVGNIVKQTEYNLDGSVSVIGSYTYNTQNRLLRIDWADEYGIFGSYVYEYDAQGQTAKLTHELSDGSIAWYQTFEYDSSGYEIKRSTFGEDEMLEKYWMYSYDEQGNLIQIDEYDAKGKLVQTTNY